VKIHKEGKKIIPPAILALFLAAVILYFLIGQFLVYYYLLAGLTVLGLMILWFFREPKIEIKQDSNSILSAADGDVVAIEPAFEQEYLKTECIQVSVFMSVFNVHINRMPVKGEIIYKQHRDGQFLPAFIAKSSEENERCTTVIRTEKGDEILVRQIAGILARRIVTYPEVGDTAGQGEQLGFIRFGSRVDLFIPKTAKIEVKLHQKVFGGKSVIATFG